MSSRMRMGVVLGVALLALAGCGGGGPAHRATATPTVDDRAAMLQVAQCLRSHGHPDFPDPVQDKDGNWTFPGSGNIPVVPACASLERQVKRRIIAENRPSAADMAKLRRVAACMRAHGVPDWPDPEEVEGTFPLPPRLQPQSMRPENNPMMRAAYDACSKYAPSGRIRTS
jgi:hypothetical protein